MPRPERNDDRSQCREREHGPRFQTFQLRGGRVGLRLVALRGRALDLHGVCYDIRVEWCLHFLSNATRRRSLLVAQRVNVPDPAVVSGADLSLRPCVRKPIERLAGM